MTTPEVTHNGLTLPQLGFGTWPLKGKECTSAVVCAIENGYRHIDTAQFYDNEQAVALGIKQSGITRQELHLTTKIWPENHGRENFAVAVERSLEALQSDYVDLLLLHWPSKTIPLSETMPLLNEAKASGKAKAIGISNFTSKLIEEAVELSDNLLAANQIEYHPFLNQDKVLASCKKHGLGVIAYCPLARGRSFNEGIIAELASKYSKTPAQIVLRWHIQQGVIVIPKSATPVRIKENIECFDFELAGEEMRVISELAAPNSRICDFDFSPKWDD